MMGNEEWNKAKTDSFRDIDGLSSELDSYRLASIGNAIVPQVAMIPLRKIKECMDNDNLFPH